MLKPRLAAALVITLLLGLLVLPGTSASAAPAPTSVSPAAGQNDQAALLLTVTGTGFAASSQLTLERATTDGSPIAATGEAVNAGGTELTASVDLRDQAPGQWSVRVTNGDATTAVIANGFTIVAVSDPSIPASGIQPNPVPRNTNGLTLQVSGSGLYRGAAISISDGDPPPNNPTNDITIVSKTFVSNTKYNVVINVPTNATQAQTLTLTNTNGRSATQSFQTKAPDTTSITVTGVSPSSRGQGYVGPLTITGTGFGASGAGASVTFSGSDIKVTSASVTGATTITANVSIAETAATDPNVTLGRTVTVTANGATNSCGPAGCFQVISGPTVTSASPATTNNGDKSFTINGTGFEANSVIKLELGDAVLETTETLNTGASPQTITAAVTFNRETPGSWRVRIISQVSGGQGTWTGLLITAPSPTINAGGVSPTSGAQGATVSVTANGTNIAKGDTLSLSPATGITVKPATNNTASSITVPISIASTATVGAHDVRIRHADGTSSSPCAGCFTVTSSDPIERFIRAAYDKMFARTVDAGGLAYWKTYLADGTVAKRINFVSFIGNNDEFRGRIVDDIFTRLLNRKTDNAGRNFFITQLRNGVQPYTIESSILASDEFYSVFGGNTRTGFINAAYPKAIGRDADPNGRAYWNAFLAQGHSRNEFTDALLFSAEGLGWRVTRLFATYLSRVVDQNGKNYWIVQFQHGLKERDFVINVVASQEFFAKS